MTSVLGEDVAGEHELVAGLGGPNLLERVFLCRRLPAFSRNLNARLARRPKLHVTDSGLAAALVNLDSAALRRHAHFGALLESFVVAELVKQLGWARRRPEVLDYRDLDGHEVDVVLEATDGTVVAIEVKAATRVSPADFAGIRYLASRLRPDLVRGVVLFAGPASVQVGDDPRMRAMPIDALWTTGTEETRDTTGPTSRAPMPGSRPASPRSVALLLSPWRSWPACSSSHGSPAGELGVAAGLAGLHVLAQGGDLGALDRRVIALVPCSSRGSHDRALRCRS